LAPAYRTAADAPDEYVALQTRTAADGILTVWNGASESAIYGAAGNLAFRAWHDSIHVGRALTFAPDDEYRVADIQARQSGRLARFIYADTAGQVAYFVQWGRFPVNQREYVRAFLASESAALARGDF
jgi:hypothetical protein